LKSYLAVAVALVLSLASLGGAPGRVEAAGDNGSSVSAVRFILPRGVVCRIRHRDTGRQLELRFPFNEIDGGAEMADNLSACLLTEDIQVCAILFPTVCQDLLNQSLLLEVISQRFLYDGV